jgi:hypothetical protein
VGILKQEGSHPAMPVTYCFRRLSTIWSIVTAQWPSEARYKPIHADGHTIRAEVMRERRWQIGLVITRHTETSGSADRSERDTPTH